MASFPPSPGQPVPLPTQTAIPTLSIVIPMHNEEANLSALFTRLFPVLDRLSLPYEVICIDDGSRDATWPALLAARAGRPRLKLLRLSRNFGKEMAMTAGLRHAAGRAVVLMDGDLQHPPELITAFVARWRDGAQMVYGVRRDRETDPPVRRWLSRGFYRLMRSLAEVDLPEGAGDFRLLDRVVVDALNAMPERSRFMKGLYGWVGFRSEGVPFDTEPRHAGRSAFTVWRLFRFALDGLASFTDLPLRIWSWVGLAMALPALLYGLAIVVKTAVYGIDVPGYASLMAATLFLGGVQLICLGVLGDYLGRVYTEVKGRPPYLIGEALGFDSAAQGSVPLPKDARGG